MAATTRGLMLNISCLLLFLGSLLPGALSTTFTLTNSCAYTVWPGLLSGSGTPALPTTGFALAPGESRAVEAPSAWSGRMWGRTLCGTGADGRFACATCDCGSGAVECAGGGAAPPCSLAEFTLDGSGSKDFYDVSLVDGSNIPVAVLPQGGSGEGCGATGCLADLNGPCPADLRVAGPDGAGIACKSACEAFGRPEDCCSGAFAGGPEACRPSAYSMFFKNACPRSYSYAYDDATSTFTCASGTAAYLVVFCPAAMSSLKSSVVSTSTSTTPELPHVNDTVSYLGRSRDAGSGSGGQYARSSSQASSSAPSPFAIAAVAALTWLCGSRAGRHWPLLSPS
ncbi:thaumatin-like protein 1 [Triticum dicoccoides]|uniref:thaumatin-like protein 1 n=1 Tax=Triticum dicoccoides TaxID=85692 RepID=UPI00189051F0|nr:thaumatin-like protein 1 [Triticum dicoccoides]